MDGVCVVVFVAFEDEVGFIDVEGVTGFDFPGGGEDACALDGEGAAAAAVVHDGEGVASFFGAL